ncbi:hypothetical protein SPRG_10781 [Saprolegnia parasitica CBS 223.65]|uniref:Uncharacterized protein n=1 Tax=Saprolegnia parasitica (strain CBS 223.65) TaxID=695850 RepID=A0A067CAL7_SAPPC|nr:hypothetical protein SPRG_10781 [Saprolegnia parasitica CBS 223.65]KDO23586.1 hypothetical protein SPRG_10781 [Saprolegnia parasitica CBS 223.65]|eukprot:XP_012205734.1 hypothetical protein SPRG_10781 [Saprolegnia parasitica CBS 223.65]
MLTPDDARARTSPLPDGTELLASPGLRFDAFAITDVGRFKTFFKTGCAVCAEASLSLTLHETSGRIQCLLPDAFWTSRYFMYLVDFTSDAARTNVHLVQCIYLGDHCIVESFSFGAIEPNVAYRWEVEWMNPFYFETHTRDMPTCSDVFYFDETTLLAHHRLSFAPLPMAVGDRTTQLFNALEAGALTSIRTALHHLAYVPPLYKHRSDDRFDWIDRGAFDVVRLLVDHGATLSGTCSDRLLARALDHSDVETVGYALEHGANVQSTNFEQTLLQRMVLAGNEAMVEVLVSAGAYLGNPCDLHDNSIDWDCSRRCQQSEAPLVAAYTSNQPRMAQLLLDLHAPIDVVQKAAPRNGLLALCLLHLTDECARRWHILQLLERGAATSIRKPNQGGMTPYALATWMDEAMILESFDFYTKAASDTPPDDDDAADLCWQSLATAWRLQTSTSLEQPPQGSGSSVYEYDSDVSSGESDDDWTLVDDYVDTVN